MANITGTSGNDTVTGTTDADTIEGLGGSDTLNGGEGNDTIFSYKEDTSLYPTDVLLDSSSSELNGGEGDDVLYAAPVNSGNDTLNGGAGNDTLYDNRYESGTGTAQLNGGSGDDLLVGGLNYFAMNGGEGSDTYELDIGSLYYGGIIDNSATDGAASVDILHLDWSSSSLTVQRLNESSIAFYLSNYGDGPVVVEGFDINPLDKVIFSDGVEWDTEEIIRQTLLNDSNTIIDANDESNSIEGTDNNDAIINNGAGTDVINGGLGDDTLYTSDEYYAVNTLNGGEGNDVLVDRGLEGSFRANLNGGEGNDSLYASAGWANFNGGTGSDHYYFNADLSVHSNDHDTNYGGTINEVVDTDVNNIDVLHLEGNILPSHTQFLRDGRHLNIHFRLESHNSPSLPAFPLVIANYFDDSQTNESSHSIEQIIFSDGTQWDTDRITQEAMDNLTHTFTLGDGNQTVELGDSASLGIEAIRFGESITPESLSFERLEENSLSIHIDSPEFGRETLHLVNISSGDELRTISFDNGLVWNSQETVAVASTLTSEDDTFIGFSRSNSTLLGGLGDDSLTGFGDYENSIIDGGAGDDTLVAGQDEGGEFSLIGGEGDDELRSGFNRIDFAGGEGSDTYVVNSLFLNSGYGGVIDNRANDSDTATDVLQIDALPSEVSIQRINSDTIEIHLTGYAPIVVYGMDSALTSPLDKIIFADNTEWDTAKIIEESLTSSDNADTIVGYNTHDNIDGQAGDDIIVGEQGNDLLVGGEGNDVYFYTPGDGNDIIDNQDTDFGFDVIRFAPGVTPSDLHFDRTDDDLVITLSATGETITVLNHFVVDNNTQFNISGIQFYADAPLDILAINSLVLGLTSGDDHFIGNGSDEIISALGGNDLIEGQGGNDQLYGAAGHDLLVGGTGNDLLVGGIGNDIYFYTPGDGNDVIDNQSPDASTDLIRFAEGVTPADLSFNRVGDNLTVTLSTTGETITVLNHFLLSEETKYAIDVIEFYADTPLELLTINGLALGTTSGADTFNGDDSGEVLSGLSGDDILNGNGGDDFLAGGEDNDILSGGEGNDIYFFSPGDGNDVIYNQDTDFGIDIIRFDMGVQPTDLDFIRNNDDLVITLSATGETIVVVNHFLLDDFTEFNISGIEFYDSPPLNFLEITSLALGITTLQDDIFIGNESDEAVSGSTGNDELYGQEGNDLLEGALGDDTLVGGLGNDLLRGGVGNDVYLFSPGDGNDVIDNADTDFGFDVIRFAAGVTPADLSINRVDSNLVVTLMTTGETITVVNHFLNDEYIESKIDGIEFDADAPLDLLAINGLAYGLSGNDDTFTGDNTTGDFINGFSGSDTINTQGGDDIIDGGEGNDLLVGGNGNDIYFFSANSGNDQINNRDTDFGIDIIRFDEGISQTDITLARNNDDLIITLSATGETITVISHFVVDENLQYHINGIEFYADAPLSLLDIDSLALGLTSYGGDTFTGTEYADFVSGAAGNDVLNGLGGNDVLDGSLGNDVLNGGDGNDQLIGSIGRDTLNGGDGDDFLIAGNERTVLDGGNGNDIYYFDDASIQYGGVIQDSSTDGISYDTLEFNGHINVNNTRMGRIGNDLLINIDLTGANPSGRADINNEPNSPIVVKDYFTSSSLDSNHSLSTVVFADGTIWDKSDIADEVLNGRVLHGTEFDDEIFAYNKFKDVGFTTSYGEDTIFGGAGNDTLYGNLYDGGGIGVPAAELIGGEGDDVFYSGGSNTFFVGGEGSDTYNVEASHYGGVIDNRATDSATATDIVHFVQGNSSSVRITRIDADTISIGHVSDPLIIRGFDSDLSSPIDKIIFSDGVEWDTAKIIEESLKGSDTSETIIAYNSDDDVSGEAGDDVIVGLDGDDTLNGGAGNDELEGGAGNDELIAGTGADLLIGGAGNDVLTSDLQQEGNSYDTLDGGLGNDLLEAGANRTRLIGGEGDDTYSFSAQSLAYGGIIDNQDASGGQDALNFGPGISSSDIQLTRDSDNGSLTILVNGYDPIVIDNFAGSTSTSNIGTNLLTTINFVDNDSNIIESWDTAEIITRSLTSIEHYSNDAESNNGVYGYVTDDEITGLDIDSKLYGGDGNDTLRGEAGDDILVGGAGEDRLAGGEGDDYLLGNTDNDSIHGGSGADTMDGGTGNDFLNGLGGDDVYVFSGDFGQDRIHNQQGYFDKDIIQFSGLAVEDLWFSQDGNHLVINVIGTENQVIVREWFNTARNDSVDQISLGELTPDSQGNILGSLNLYQEDVASVVKAMSDALDDANLEVNDIVDNGLPESINTLLNGTSGINTQVWRTTYAGESSDIISADDNDNVIFGYAGDDKLDGNGGNDTIYGGTGNDDVIGDNGDDILIGGDGDDFIRGGNGNDTYIFSGDFGRDRINNYGSYFQHDIVNFTDKGIDDLWFSQASNSNDLIIYEIGTDNQLIIRDWFGSYDRGVGQISIGELDPQTNLGTLNLYQEEVDDLVDAMSSALSLTQPMTNLNTMINSGIVPTEITSALEDIKAEVWRADYNGEASDIITGDQNDNLIEGYAGKDKLRGGAGNDIINGGSANDDVIGEDGDDILNGGSGNDLLAGGNGDDTYIFNGDFGQDRLSNYSGYQERFNHSFSRDIARFEGLTEDDLWFTNQNNDLVIHTFNPDKTLSDNTVVVRDWFDDIGTELDEIQVEGSTLMREQVATLVQELATVGDGGVPVDLNALSQEDRNTIETAIDDVFV